MITGAGVAYTSSSSTIEIQAKASVPIPVLRDGVTQSSTQRGIRGKGVIIDRNQIYASGTIFHPAA